MHHVHSSRFTATEIQLQLSPTGRPERFPLGGPFNRPSIGFVAPTPLGDVSPTWSVSTAALRRRHTRLPTATTATTPPMATTGQKMVWSNQNRRWTFATWTVACRTRAKLSMSAFGCLLAKGRRTHGPEGMYPGGRSRNPRTRPELTACSVGVVFVVLVARFLGANVDLLGRIAEFVPTTRRSTPSAVGHRPNFAPLALSRP
jgi:hypothetical protein